MFHFGDVDQGYFTGNFELTLENVATGETWECFDGWYTRDANLTDLDVRYTDVEVPETLEIKSFSFEIEWNNIPEKEPIDREDQEELSQPGDSIENETE